MEFPRGGGFWKTENFEEMYELQAELVFPEGWGGGHEKIPPVGKV